LSREFEPRFGALLWLMRSDWSALAEAVTEAEKSGFDSIWVSDHLLANSGDPADPVFEVFSTLSALAAITRRVRIGTLVAAVTLRHPALLAKSAVTIDHVSEGRMILGLGTGWFDREHSAHGLDFGEQYERSDRLDEALPLVRALLDGREVNHFGRYYRLDSVRHGPAAVQKHLPILLGGEGRSRTLRSVAAHADLWHARGGLELLLELRAVLAEHCRSIGRDVAEVTPITTRWIVLRDDPAAAEGALRASLAGHGVETFDEDILALGPPDRAARAIAPTLHAGFRDILVSFRSPYDLETIHRLPELRDAISAVPISA
jgi:alkanesulfonate monooxygenase SsuD/methylene tetrahydromethanopterin reductase-like flavin-dependent oxidoreductase (luciferase family)